jgi:hypothetical protein
VAEHLAGGASAQPVGVVDPLPAGQGRVDKGHSLDTDVGRAGRLAEVDVGVEQLAEHEPLGQAGGKDQAGIGDGMVVVEGDGDPVRLWDDRTEQVPSWLGAMVVLSTPFSQVSGHLFAVYPPSSINLIGGSRHNRTSSWSEAGSATCASNCSGMGLPRTPV